MDRGQLSTEELEQIYRSLQEAQSQTLSDYSAPEKVQEDEKEYIQNSLKYQKGAHRRELVKLIKGLTVSSFVFLVVIIIFKMAWKIRHPEYDVISDAIINVLAVGVFAELLGVVAIIAKEVWRDV